MDCWKIIKDALEVASYIAAIGTAAVATCAWRKYQRDNATKQEKLENYLKAEKAKQVNQGQRTLNHLMAHVGLSHADILQAAFDSKKIKLTPKESARGHAIGVWLEYDGPVEP
jgi:hypothetical protein